MRGRSILILLSIQTYYEEVNMTTDIYLGVKCTLLHLQIGIILNALYRNTIPTSLVVHLDKYFYKLC